MGRATSFGPVPLGGGERLTETERPFVNFVNLHQDSRDLDGREKICVRLASCTGNKKVEKDGEEREEETYASWIRTHDFKVVE